MKDLEKISELIDQKFIAQIKQIVHAARSKAYSSVNFAQVEANRLIGQRIVGQEQNGKARAAISDIKKVESGDHSKKRGKTCEAVRAGWR
jgi:hypothetical protein